MSVCLSVRVCARAALLSVIERRRFPESASDWEAVFEAAVRLCPSLSDFNSRKAMLKFNRLVKAQPPPSARRARWAEHAKRLQAAANNKREARARPPAAAPHDGDAKEEKVQVEAKR